MCCREARGTEELACKYASTSDRTAPILRRSDLPRVTLETRDENRVGKDRDALASATVYMGIRTGKKS